MKNEWMRMFELWYIDLMLVAPGGEKTYQVYIAYLKCNYPV